MTGRYRRNPGSAARAARRVFAPAALGAVFAVFAVNATQDAVANGGTRALTIYHVHTKEQETVTFKSYGSYSSAGLQKLNWLLRDWRQDEPTRMDPQLFDILWEVYRASGSSGPIHVVSAYRSPGTNAMLARRSRGVAKNSHHMSGKAVDFSLPDVSMATVRDIGLRLQSGGVGYYPRANNPWVHLDTGGVRHWPKVSRDHLVRLFPDERTVHIPRDGKPLAGFEAARAIIEARGGSVSSGYIDIAEGRATGRTLFQILFGGGEGDDEGDIAPRGKRGGRTVVASRTRSAPPPTNDTAEGNALAFLSQPNSNTSAAVHAPALRPTRPTRPTPIEEPKPAPPQPEARPAEPPKPVEQPKQIEVAALPPRPPLAAGADDDGKRVNVQLPPRRPSNFAELVAATSAKPLLVTVQLPPPRPAQLDAVEMADAPPERRAEPGMQSASAGRPVNVPLPQPRPAASATAPSSIGLRGEAESIAVAFAPRPESPAARIIPAAPMPAAAPRRQTGSAPDERDRRALASLISSASAMSVGDTAPVRTPTVAAIANVRTLTGRFEATPQVDERPKGFSGSAIRPIGQAFR